MLRKYGKHTTSASEIQLLHNFVSSIMIVSVRANARVSALNREQHSNLLHHVTDAALRSTEVLEYFCR